MEIQFRDFGARGGATSDGLLASRRSGVDLDGGSIMDDT